MALFLTILMGTQAITPVVYAGKQEDSINVVNIINMEKVI